MELPQNISGEKIAFAAQQLYTKDFDVLWFSIFCDFNVLWFRRTRAYKN